MHQLCTEHPLVVVVRIPYYKQATTGPYHSHHIHRRQSHCAARQTGTEKFRKKKKKDPS